MLCFTMLTKEQYKAIGNGGTVCELPVVKISCRPIKEALAEMSLVPWDESCKYASICYVADTNVSCKDVLERFEDYTGPKLLPLMYAYGKHPDVTVYWTYEIKNGINNLWREDDFWKGAASYDTKFLLYRVRSEAALDENVRKYFTDLRYEVFEKDVPCDLEYIDKLIRLAETFSVYKPMPNPVLEWCRENAPKAYLLYSDEEILEAMRTSWVAHCKGEL